MIEDEFSNAIAIIGIAGRFPGADNVQHFWTNLCNGVDSVSKFSDEDLISSGVLESLIKNSNYVRARSILKDIEYFDAEFFGFNPREAQITDPQHRIFLECAWESLEDAGYDPDNYEGLIGVYGGTSSSSYFLNNIHTCPDIEKTFGEYLLRIGNDKDYLTTKVSYKLNLKGPSITVQTACSTSLMAVGIACNHLLTYQCDMAIVGGVSITTPQKSGYLYQEGIIFSPEGQCRPFDAEAKGTVPGNGAGTVVLKRLQDALHDGDHIYAIIKGYGINNDGSEKMGYTAPSILGQAEVVNLAISMADINPESITYLEAHGTGTLLGDPIEIQALTHSYRNFTEKNGYCAIGSIKGNIGHLIEASGIVGLIKTTLALHHQLIPPSINFSTPNPHIDFDNSPFFVNTKLKNWETNQLPRRAAVSSFGFGGTNAHVILEEEPKTIITPSSRPLQLILVSAKTPSSLKKMVINLRTHFEKNPEISLSDVAYTLQIGRKTFAYKQIIIAGNINEAASKLREREALIHTTFYNKKKKVIFMFPDIGSEIVKFNSTLYETECHFSKAIDECISCLQHLTRNVGQNSLFHPTFDEAKEIAQARLFMTEYALARLLNAWGIEPAAMIGNGVGEHVIMCLQGICSLEEALQTSLRQNGQVLKKLNNHFDLHAEPNDPEILIIEIGPRNCEYEHLFHLLSELILSGTSINWKEFYKFEKRKRVSLPTYHFEKKRFWIDSIIETNSKKADEKVKTFSNFSISSIENILLDIWKEILGINSINLDDNFFQLGGDSILSIQIIAQIEESFNVQLRIQTMIDHPTIAVLAEEIFKKLNSLNSINNPSQLPDGVVVLQHRNDNKPLFFIHPIGGNVFCYRDLVKYLNYDGPIYGLQSLSFNCNHKPTVESILKIASDYIVRIRKIQVNGPYHLIGSSFGGLIAYEMARQLSEADNSVSLLAMIDIVRPDDVSQKFIHNMDILTFFVELFEGKEIINGDNISQNELFKRLLKSMSLNDLPQNLQFQMIEQMKAYYLALQQYHPKAYNGKIIFFESEDRFFRNKAISLGSTWKNLGLSGIEIFEVPGNHFSMLMEPHVKKIGDLLNLKLNSSKKYG